MLDITTLFCSVDDFWKSFEIVWYKNHLSYKSPRGPQCGLSMSEIMTIIILFHQSNYRNFKYFYLFLYENHKKEFPKMPSYSRFVTLKKSVLVPLYAYLYKQKGIVTGISFIDSTVLRVCNTKRSNSNKVFKGIAKKGKSSMGWFFGFKLHLIINEKGEILSFQLTPGNVSDLSPVKNLAKGLWGKLFGDRGYISSNLFKDLLNQNLKLITRLKSNMKNKLMDLSEKIILRKRAIIESVNDQLKNISQIEHSRHRSPSNFLVNLLSGLIAYSHQKKKPSLNLNKKSFALC